MAANELLINTKNKKRAERELPPEIVAVQGITALAEEAARAEGQRRKDALDRLKVRAQRDVMVADLLTVLGLEWRE